MLTLQLRLLLVALRVYARIPLPAHMADRAGGESLQPARALRYLPLAGVAVAVPAAIVYVCFALWLPHAVAVLGAMLAALLLGGAVHERGLCAWLDALEARSASLGATASACAGSGAGAGATSPGLPAVIAIALTLLARLEMLSSIDPSWIALVLVCAAVWSRGCAVLVASALGTMKPTARDTVIALALGAAPLVAAAAWTQDPTIFVTAAALALVCAALVRRQTRRRLGASGAAAAAASAARDPGARSPGGEPDPQESPAEADALASRRAMNAVLGAVQVIAELAFLIGVLATLSVAEDVAEPEFS
jgi:adenosylcobinamide-GDP ribazoletransferase